MYKTVRSKNLTDKTTTAALNSHNDHKTLQNLGKCKIEYDDGSCYQGDLKDGK